ncbi:MAG: hypothetical protein ACYDB7_10205, partial [Mycobacteriales bacterium]
MEGLTEAGSGRGRGPSMDRRLLLGIVAGVAALAAVVAFVLVPSLTSSSGTPAATAGPARVVVAAPAAAGPAQAPAVSALTVLPPAFTANIGRDPFKPLLVPPPPSAAPAPAPTTATSTAPVTV